MNQQGEVALIVEHNRKGDIEVKAFTTPSHQGGFKENEKRDLFLSASLDVTGYTKAEKITLDQYLTQAGGECNFASKASLYQHWEGKRSKTSQRDEEAAIAREMKELSECSDSSPSLHSQSRKCHKGCDSPEMHQKETYSQTVLSQKKYKPVARKVKPVLGTLPEDFRVKREIKGDPLANMPKLSPNPPEFIPTGRYTQERKDQIHDRHKDFLQEEELKLLHQLIAQQNEAFAWTPEEGGRFREDFFPDVEIPVIEHTPWVLKNIPIPPGIYDEVCKVIKAKIDAGVYEPSSSSYRSRWFCVIKKDGKSLRLVHNLEPLNAVTIAHSGIPPATEHLAEQFAGRACGTILDLYVGYDERKLHLKSRDLTTFQTPFGALRLVTLPMGWTNSVPIFHDDVTHILREEIPHVTIPFIDDIPIKGPQTRYEQEDGSYETIPENPGIRRFVWEHLQDVNRILQRMKYSGGTFSGPKAYICRDEFMVVGHRCTYEGRKPETDKAGVIARWGPCKDLHDVRSFLGTVGVCRAFIKDFAKLAEPLEKLKRKDTPFHWGKAEQESMDKLKEALANCPALKPLNYEWDSEIVLAVDTSWKAVGFYIYQADPKDPRRKHIARFCSITLSEREARFSQPKRELYGLLRALESCKYWLIGVRNLVVETDALYLKGMLNNPGLGPNATINRWIEKILMYHFKLRHVPGKTFGPDGLSRRDPMPGDETHPNSEEDGDDINLDLEFEKPDREDPDPYEFDSFKHMIDTRGGYLNVLATSAEDIEKDCKDMREKIKMETDAMIKQFHQQHGEEAYKVAKDYENWQERFKDDYWDYERPTYEECSKNRTNAGKRADERLPRVRQFLKEPYSRPEGMPEHE